MEKAIELFLKTEDNLTFCTAQDNEPHCASCYYAYLPEEQSLVIKSDRSTKHISNALLNAKIAGTIVPGTHKTGIVKGIQFTGIFSEPAVETLSKVKQTYYIKHPMSVGLKGDFWRIELNNIKMLDFAFGVGKKLNWQKEKKKELTININSIL